MQADALAAREDAPLTAFEPYLTSENDVMRCAAIRALASVQGPSVRDALLAARMDTDPDVRSDAMEGLVHLALPEDAVSIRESLMGDPVREVKQAAIRALVRLDDARSIPLLRSLALSRSDDQVAWEDEDGDWEEWLDIQALAITALGDLGAEEAIGDLITAQMDELGQNLDLPVFGAFSKMGDAGVAALLVQFEASRGAVRRRVAQALAEASPEALAAHLDDLVAAPEAELRLLAVSALPKGDTRFQDFAIADLSADVRAAAVTAGAPGLPDLAQACLADPDDRVKAAALKALCPPFDAAFHEALVDNMLMWLDRAGPVLATEAAMRLPLLAPNRAEGPLLAVIDTPAKPLELRVAAVKALGTPALELDPGLLTERLDNPARQVRVALLTLLRRKAEQGAEDVVLVVASAIAGALELAVPETAPEPDGPEAGTPKEGAGPRRIWITPEGDIVENEDRPEPVTGQSTLDSILAGAAKPEPPKLNEDTPEESGAKRAKRRAVEGSGDLAGVLAVDAMRVFAGLEASEITQAMASRLHDGDETVRRAAWEALAAAAPSEDLRAPAAAAYRDADPVVRMATFKVLVALRSPDHLAEGLTDADALIRAAAVAHLPVAAALEFVGDPALAVRTKAVETVLAEGAEVQLAEAVLAVLGAERSDTLATLVIRSDTAKATALATLGDTTTSDRAALVILRALESGAPR